MQLTSICDPNFKKKRGSPISPAQFKLFTDRNPPLELHGNGGPPGIVAGGAARGMMANPRNFIALRACRVTPNSHEFGCKTRSPLGERVGIGMV
jgi:hypothetical protein